MIKIPFNLHLAKQIQAGVLPGKIVTRDGGEVFITCWCINNEKKRIQAFVRMSERDMAEIDYSKEGLLINKSNESIWDLMLELYDDSSEDNNNLPNDKAIEINMCTIKYKNSFKPFDRVLVRNSSDQMWEAAIFSRYDNSSDSFPYVTTSEGYKYCIPYNKNTKHLIGATDDYSF